MHLIAPHKINMKGYWDVYVFDNDGNAQFGNGVNQGLFLTGDWSTITPTSTTSSTPTTTSTPSNTSSPSDTLTPSSTNTITTTPSSTATNEHTETATSSPTNSYTLTPSSTTTSTASNTLTPSETANHTPSDTATSSPSSTSSPSPTATSTDTPIGVTSCSGADYGVSNLPVSFFSTGEGLTSGIITEPGPNNGLYTSNLIDLGESNSSGSVYSSTLGLNSSSKPYSLIAKSIGTVELVVENKDLYTDDSSSIIHVHVKDQDGKAAQSGTSVEINNGSGTV